jgi:aspartate/methionine/tyrosine aminotransferase
MKLPMRFSELPEYAFPRLRALLDPIEPGGDVLHMSIGEPKHPFPFFVGETVAEHAADFGRYPPNDGTPELRAAISGWLGRRYGVSVNADNQIITLNGTREGLFNAALALSPEQKNGQKPLILMPNPFYQCYAVAALAAGAEPYYVSALAENGFLPDFAALSPEILNRTTVLYICSPANPQGAVANEFYWRTLMELAETYDFRIFADECYSEIYRDDPPVGALEVAGKMNVDPERVTVFHSLSKRSNVPGLRSGFAAGGPASIAEMKKLRNYAGAPLPLPIQRASEKLWQDEDHVTASREIYRKKYDLADHILGNMDGYSPPTAGFFLWIRVGECEAAAKRLWSERGIRVLPGGYLARDPVDGSPNPGAEYIRVALVAELDEVDRGLREIRECLRGAS